MSASISPIISPPNALILSGPTPKKPENLIAAEVQRLGLLPVLSLALRAWWHRPKHPPDLSPHLRADIGLPPPNAPRHWTEIDYQSVDFDRYS